MAILEILTGSRSGERVALGPESYTIGSGDAAQIVCRDADVEWSHARIYADPKRRFFVEDLRSRGGVRVNQSPVLHKSLRDGDEIAVGQVRFRFADGEPALDATTSGAAGGGEAATPEGAIVERARSDFAGLLSSMGNPTPPAMPSAGRGHPGRGLVSFDSVEELLVPPEALITDDPEKLRGENNDLRERLKALEGKLKKKQVGLSLATESFVEQLERANERLATGAVKQQELEARLKEREAELAKLKAERESLDRTGNVRVLDLAQKLDAVRRDFEEMERLLKVKAAAYSKLVVEAKEVTRKAMADIAQTPSAASVEDILAGKAPQKPGVDVTTTVKLSEMPQLHPPGTAGRRARKRRSGGEVFKAGMTLAAIFCFAVMLLALVHWGDPGQRGAAPKKTSDATPASTSGGAKPKTTFGSQTAGAPTTSTPKPEAPKTERVKPPAPAPAAATPAPVSEPAAQAPPEQAAAEETDSGSPLFEPLRKAVRARDDSRIAAEEQALIDKGAAILAQVKSAYEAEKQFNVKVSLQYVLSALEGGSGVGSVLDKLRTTQDAAEKMRLAFMLMKYTRPEDVAALEQALQTEQDAIVKKYIVRALGQSGGKGSAGTAALLSVARSDPDRNQRIEAIRSLESKAEGPEAAEATTLFADLAQNDQDPQIRSMAIRALASTGGTDHTPFFQKILQEDDRTNNRAEAAKFYGRVGTRADLPMLEQITEQEKVYYIRQKLQKAVEDVKRREQIE